MATGDLRAFVTKLVMLIGTPRGQGRPRSLHELKLPWPQGVSFVRNRRGGSSMARGTGGNNGAGEGGKWRERNCCEVRWRVEK
ncbi:hypothetical protein NL676_009177 [Syzygium grande]|nr:hypothetical protein NL676_009177 [Syzygium grande]